MKVGLHDFGSFLNNGKIYVLGGDGSENENMFLKTMEYYPDIDNFGEFLAKANRFHSFSKTRYKGNLQIYNIKNDTWTKSNLKLRKRAYNNANFYNNKIYVLGGKNLASHGRYFNEYLDNKIEVVDLEKNTVTIDNTNPHQAVNFASFNYKDNIIVVGGSVKLKKNGFREYSNKVHLHNLKTGLWYNLATMPVAKEVNGVIIDSIIYLIGGFNNKPLNSIETYNITTGKWQKVGELFKALERPAITHHKQFIYIFDDGKIYTYNTQTKELKKYFIGISVKAAQLYYANHKLYILGGYKLTNYSITNSSDLFSINLNEFDLTKVIESKTL